MTASTHTFTIDRHDLLPPLTWAATYSDGTIIDLSTVTNPEFHMRLASAADLSAPKIDAAAVVTDGPGGIIRYNWAGTDTDTAGTYNAEFEVVVSGKPLTIPTDRQLIVRVRGDIA